MTSLVPRDSGWLATVDAAQRVLASVERIDEATELVNMAESAKVYARNVLRSREAQNHAAHVSLLCQRKAGELLQSSGIGKGKKSVTLTDLGVGETDSSRWQRIARIPDDVFADAVERIKADDELTTAGLLRDDGVRRATHQRNVAEARGVAGAENYDNVVIEDLATCDPIYSTIVVDPPWRYDNRATRNAAERVYRQEEGRAETTMSQDDLLKLTIPAAPNAHLYLWVTNSFIRDGFELMEQWGFTYKTCLTWCKPQIGMGNYFRSTTEHVLFGLRGRLPTLRNNVPTHFVADRGDHSAKPDSFFDLIATCSPGPYLEMFARRDRRFGWHVWGNEA